LSKSINQIKKDPKHLLGHLVRKLFQK